MANCAICGQHVITGLAVHKECLAGNAGEINSDKSKIGELAAEQTVYWVSPALVQGRSITGFLVCVAEAILRKKGLDPAMVEFQCDCTKIDCARTIQSELFRYYGEDEMTAAMIWACSGPKVDDTLRDDCIRISWDFVSIESMPAKMNDCPEYVPEQGSAYPLCDNVSCHRSPRCNMSAHMKEPDLAV